MSNFELDCCKRKRKRTVIPDTHIDKLEKLFQRETWPNRAKKEALALEIGQSEHFVSVWFQNRRARMKREDGYSQNYKLMDSRIPCRFAADTLLIAASNSFISVSQCWMY